MKRIKSIIRKYVAKTFEIAGPIRVLFIVENEIGFANQAPVLQLMRNNPLFRCAVTTEDNQKPAFYDSELSALLNAYFVANKSACLKVWHYVISTDKHTLWLKWDSVGVMLGHGSCIGNGRKSSQQALPWFVQEAEQSNIAIVVCQGHGALQEIAQVSPSLLKNPHKALLISAPPKLGILANGHFDRKQTLKNLGLDPKLKTIIVASHWSEMSVLRDVGAPILDYLCTQQDACNVILTAHPKLWTLSLRKDGFNGGSLYHELLEIASNHKHRCAIVTSATPYSLMASSDLLLCDHSSICVEFSLLGRPIGLYRNPEFACQSATTERLYRKSSVVFHDLPSLEFALKELNAPDYDAVSAARNLSEYFLRDVSASAERITSFLLACGRVSSTRSSRWRRVKDIEEEYLQSERSCR